MRLSCDFITRSTFTASNHEFFILIPLSSVPRAVNVAIYRWKMWPTNVVDRNEISGHIEFLESPFKYCIDSII